MVMQESLDDRRREGSPAQFFNEMEGIPRPGDDPYLAQPMAQPASFAPAGEMIDERMQWQSPARNQILQDFNLNPATTGAGFQMQGTNTPTAVTDFIAAGSPQSSYSNMYLAGTPAGAGIGAGDPNPIAYQTGYINPFENAFDMNRGKTWGGVGRYNVDPNSLVTNPSFPMGGMYNYVTDPFNKTGSYYSPVYGSGITNFDPYNALANTGWGGGFVGYNPSPFSQPLFNVMEGGVPRHSGSNLIDPFQNYR